MSNKIYVLLVLMFCSSAFAAGDWLEQQPQQNYFAGFYVGGGIGANYITGSVDSTFTDNEAIYEFLTPTVYTQPRIYSFNKNFDNLSLATTLFFGYGDVFGKSFYLGGEAYARIFPAEFDVSDTSTINNIKGKSTMKVTSTASGGIGARVGYLFTSRVMIYLLGAADTGEIDFKVKHSSAGHSYGSDHYGGWYFHLIPAIGVEAMVTKKLALRAQYSFYLFGPYDGEKQQDNLILNFNWLESTASHGFSDANVKIGRVAQNVAHIDIIYHFNGI